MDEVVLGRYRLIELIGRGGMGRLFKAHDTVMGHSRERGFTSGGKGRR
jgi:hypothetical protein